jgi:hypothetical protein
MKILEHIKKLSLQTLALKLEQGSEKRIVRGGAWVIKT